MKKTYLGVLCIALAAVLVVGAGKEKDAAEDDDVTKLGKQLTQLKSGTFFYANDFEKNDDTGGFTSDSGEVEWVAGGPKKSTGCVKFSKPSEANITGEMYLEWYDAMSSVEFDYFVKDFDEEFYVMARAKKAGGNTRAQVNGYVKGKWAHAKVRAGNLAQKGGKSGSGDDFSNFIISGSGPNVSNGYIMIDNLVIYALGKKRDK